ncbi:hypothetical protein [Olleya sp. R77988]|uniref:hypothetical protein n=1 Tax=Olleya sp. R77988 TaxID=3093875 RepID=UPI0037C7EC90
MTIRFKEEDNKGVSVIRIVSVLANLNGNSLSEMEPLIKEYRDKGSFSILIKKDTLLKHLEEDFDYHKIKFLVE